MNATDSRLPSKEIAEAFGRFELHLLLLIPSAHGIYRKLGKALDGLTFEELSASLPEYATGEIRSTLESMEESGLVYLEDARYKKNPSSRFPLVGTLDYKSIQTK